VDRLIALVLLRFKTDLRTLLRTRERVIGLLLAIPGIALSSLLVAGLAFLGIRALEQESPEALGPALGAAATLMGVGWALSPILAGVAFTESHDVTRLLHFPIPLRTLVLSSLIANLAQPMVLAEIPLALAVAAALSGSLWRFPFALAGVLLTLAFILTLSQVVGLALHGLARNRRLFERALAAGLGISFLVSLVPLLILLGGPGHLSWLLRVGGLLELLPFAWGVRAALHAGQGELLPFLGFSTAGMLAILTAMATSAGLIGLVHRGELDLGESRATNAKPARLVFDGSLGTLLEKDLRVAWRDPALKTSLLLSLVAPVLMLVLVASGGAPRAGSAVLVLASLIGLSGFGSNALGLERRGLGLLLGFPVPRWRVIVAKNLGILALRAPGLMLLALVGAALASPRLLLPALAVAVSTYLVSAGMDALVAVLFPVAAPDPGRNPYAQASGGRGLGSALVSGLFLLAAVALSAPFAFLCWLPLLLGQPWLWLAAVPLAVAGAGAIYGMLVAAAASLLERREPEILERVLGEA
jgi:ABC-2 type transport system permease protein